MTLQYRTRDLSDDRKWHRRTRLCALHISAAVDRWCRDDGAFPIESTVSSVLFLFSPHCDLDQIRESELCVVLSQMALLPEAEIANTWPHQDEGQRTRLIDALTDVLNDAVAQWTVESIATPSLDVVNQRIVSTLLEHRYVMIHHTQTTKRDNGGFHGVG